MKTSNQRLKQQYIRNFPFVNWLIFLVRPDPLLTKNSICFVVNFLRSSFTQGPVNITGAKVHILTQSIIMLKVIKGKHKVQQPGLPKSPTCQSMAW